MALTYAQQIADFLDRHPFAGYDLFGKSDHDSYIMYRAMTVADATIGLTLEAKEIDVDTYDFGSMPTPESRELVNQVKEILPDLDERLTNRELEAARLHASRNSLRVDLAGDFEPAFVA